MARRICLGVAFVLLAYGAGLAIRTTVPDLAPSFGGPFERAMFGGGESQILCVLDRPDPVRLVLGFCLATSALLGLASTIWIESYVTAARRRTRLLARFGRVTRDIERAPVVALLDAALARSPRLWAGSPAVATVAAYAGLRERFATFQTTTLRRMDAVVVLVAVAGMTSIGGVAYALTEAFTGARLAESSSMVAVWGSLEVASRILFAGVSIASGHLLLLMQLREDAYNLISESREVARRELEAFVRRSVRQ